MNLKLLSMIAATGLISTAAYAQSWSKNSNRGNYSRGNSDAGGSGSALPNDFSILQNKSIFNKDRRPGMTVGPRTYPPGGDPGSDPRRNRNRIPALRGILRQPDGYVGLLEVPRSGDIVIIRKGDSLPNDAGIVTDITLDSISIAATADQPQHNILVGQNLTGAVAEVETSSSSSSSDNGSATSTSQPGSNGGDNTASSAGSPQDITPPSGPGPSLEEIRARLMARRKQQNGR